jgi:hypothetical protein
LKLFSNNPKLARKGQLFKKSYFKTKEMRKTIAALDAPSSGENCHSVKERPEGLPLDFFYYNVPLEQFREVFLDEEAYAYWLWLVRLRSGIKSRRREDGI